MASNTFIFGSKTSLNGIPVSNNGARNNKPHKMTANIDNKRCKSEFQIDRKKNAGINKNSVPNNRIRSPVPRSSASSSFGGSVLSQSNKPWFVATHDPSSFDEMKELNPGMWKDSSTSDQQLDKDVLY